MKVPRIPALVILCGLAVAGLSYLAYGFLRPGMPDEAAPSAAVVEPLVPATFSREDQGFVECPEDLNVDADETVSEPVQAPEGSFCVADLLPWAKAPAPFQADSSLESLRPLCGDVFADFLFYHGEGRCQWGTAMFHGTGREIQIVWKNWKDRKIPAVLRFVGRDLHFEQGLKPGMLVKDLVQINGRPLTLAGFGWEGSGLHRSFQGGSLQMFDSPDAPYRIHYALDWVAFDAASDDEHASVIVGDTTLESTNPALEKFQGQVESIDYRYPGHDQVRP